MSPSCQRPRTRLPPHVDASNGKAGFLGSTGEKLVICYAPYELCSLTCGIFRHKQLSRCLRQLHQERHTLDMPGASHSTDSGKYTKYPHSIGQAENLM